MTISIDDNINKAFYTAVRKKLGDHKGALARAIEQAILQWLAQQQQETLTQEMLSMLEGFDMGKVKTKKRAELYKRSYSAN